MKSRVLVSFSFILLSLALSPVAEAGAILTVKQAGGGNFTTIQACANAANPGDTCMVFAGVYNEYVTLTKSGSLNNPITFQVNPGDNVQLQGFNLGSQSYITIGGPGAGTGFEMTNNFSIANAFISMSGGGTQIIIQNNNMHGGPNGGGGAIGAQCIRSGFNTITSYVYILHNKIEWCGQAPLNPSSGIVMRGDHWLLDGNYIQHVNNYIQSYATFSIVRNNYLAPTDCSDFPGTSCPVDVVGQPDWHIDGIEHSTSPPNACFSNSFNVFENNAMVGNDSGNGHLGVWHSGGCGDHNSIVRFNTILNYGTFFVLDGTSVAQYAKVKTYNNTIANVAFPSFNATSFTGPASPDCSSINNLWYNTVKKGGYVILLDATTAPTFTAHNDLAFNPGCTGSGCFSGFITSEAGVVLNQDPLFADPTSDVHLQAGSPAIGAGGSLTNVAATDAGTGITLKVKDAAYFQDGYNLKGVQGDWIRVGTTGVAQVSSVDYTNNILTLKTSITRSPGDPVFLFKLSNGLTVLFGNAPDIGAFPFGQQQAPPPDGLTVIVQ